MTFRRSASAVIIASVVLVITTVSLVSYLISHRMTADFEDGQFDLMGQVLQSTLNAAEMKAIATSEAVAAMPEVRTAFAARDRAALLAATQEAYRVQHEKYGISQAQFHLEPAVSFLRVHNPARFGDDLAGNRRMVVEVNRSRGIRRGIEITSSSIGIFGTLPMTDAAGAHTGSFEVSLEIAPLLDELKKAYGFELGFFVDEKLLRETATAINPEVLGERNRVGSFLRFAATHPELLRALVTGDAVAVTEPAQYMREVNGVPYGVLLQPVYDYARRQIGVVGIAADFSQTRSADGQAVVWQLMLALASGLLQIGVILVLLRGRLLRPLAVLNERVAAQADGAAGRGLPESGDWCDEMRDLAGSCDRLAARAGVGAGGGAGVTAGRGDAS